ncbi:hypothetical protein FOA43_002668 [Brettanomyces nanus]|uniref:ubiquitinyl hydrolase 1 n=1 Tax=Eeniella nana TaxID=13502 RepID=A0A875S1S3_EENNA|nr:uncharacterized protein FOA43_002668 [Brettanomyces nanus]QPG75316.1 hypothetical protein FOA43_002668 [Brettanomyces nanus]
MSESSDTTEAYEEAKETQDNTDSNGEPGLESNVEPNVEPNVESAYNILQQRRVEARKIESEESQKTKEGDKLCAVPKGWLERFFSESFDESAQDIDNELGRLSSRGILDETGVVLTKDFDFISRKLFDLLCQWYGWKDGDPVVEREAYFNAEKAQMDVETWPLYIILHVLTANASQVNRFSSVDATPFLVSSHSTAKHLKETVERTYDVDRRAKTRIWQIAVKDGYNFPSVVLPSFEETITESMLIHTGGKYGLRTLEESKVRSGHILMELQQPDGSYLMDTASELMLDDGLVGLNNLGNTCYLNSALQCLVHIPELTYYFLYDYYKKEINKENPLGSQGKMAEAYGTLAKHLFDRRLIGQQTSFAPRDFRYTIGFFNSIFSDYRQQDSQEFIAFLLDGLHEDLNRVIQKPYVEKPELPQGKVEDQEEIRKLARQCWLAHKKRNNSVVIDLFVGQYKSTLVCPECGYVSITFDPYNDLTLPLPITRKWNHKVKILFQEGRPKLFEVDLPRSATFYDLKAYVSRAIDVPMNEIICLEVFQSQVYKNYEDKDSDTRYLPISDLISKGDDIWFYQVCHEPGDLVVPVFSTVLGGPLLKNKVFGIPFFITLNEKERNSYGAIREKLEKRYTQLSTYQYFEKVRSQSKGEYSLDDFDKLDDILKKELEEYDEEDDLASIISSANPELPGDCAFHVKLLGGGPKVRTRRSFGSRYGHHVGYHSFAFGQQARCKEIGKDEDDEDDGEGDDDNLWIPETNGNFDGLQDLLDKLDPLKAALYTYHAIDDKDETEKGEEGEEGEEVEEEDELMRRDQDGEEDSDAMDEEAEEEEEETGETAEVIEVDGNDKDMAISDSSSGSNVTEEVKYISLVEDKMALVCQWEPELFDVFFTGLEDEEDGGRETWTHPPILHNAELEDNRKEAALKRKKTIDLDDCLDMFSRPEVLGERDLWYCPYCKGHRQATKKIEIWSVPDILTIHLKRFESSRSFSDKIDAVVEFPIEGLDLSKYVTDGEAHDDLLYDLFAVDNHFGGMGGGHYTAYVKNFVDDKWYYYDDSRVTVANPVDSIRGSAYLLFYRKRTSGPVGGEYFRKMEEEISQKRAERDEKLKELSKMEELLGDEDGEREDTSEYGSSGSDIDGTVKRRKKMGAIMMGRSSSDNVNSPLSDREEVMSTVSSTANAPDIE